MMAATAIQAAGTQPLLASLAADAAAATPAAAVQAAAKTGEADDKTSRVSAKCQVPDCISDLQEQSRYNRRYRICDDHRRMLSVEMNGAHLRFCQQCARLQPVEKFKADRKSCQTSLELHNKRQAEGASAAVAAGFMAPPKCQVPGCSEDLLKHKVYNQRYKICPFHRTQPAVEIDGAMVRFCQQCAKTHSVADFEGNKRSCREKLERINNRRLDLKMTLENREANPDAPLPVTVTCQVPGCTHDPLDMKVYNIRNKVCNAHLGMAEVDLNGEKMRFCRQCAKFQTVDDFDGTKRSCRVRLERHNERRRVAAQNARTGKSEATLQPSHVGAITPVPAAAAVAPAVEVRTDATPRRAIRPRKSGGIPAPAVCQVPNCCKDLKDEKVYNQRYKVCPEHLQMPEVEMNGMKMRFCQQCARFQECIEFDGLKRSCRARLAKHNQRGRAAYQTQRAKKAKRDDTEMPEALAIGSA